MREALLSIPNTKGTGHRSLFRNELIGRRTGNGTRKLGRRISYFKFAFVRHPLDRLVSCWNRHTQINNMFNENGKPIESFDYFIDKLASNEYTDKYRYTVLPMVNWLQDENGKIDMEFIGRFENLSNDWDSLAEQIGCELPLPRKNNTRHKRWMKYFTPKTRKMMEDYYKEDMETFNY